MLVIHTLLSNVKNKSWRSIVRTKELSEGGREGGSFQSGEVCCWSTELIVDIPYNTILIIICFFREQERSETTRRAYKLNYATS